MHFGSRPATPSEMMMMMKNGISVWRWRWRCHHRWHLVLAALGWWSTFGWVSWETTASSSLSSIHPPQAQSLPTFAKSPSKPSLSSSTTASPFILSPYNSFSPSYNQPGLVHLLPPGTSTSLPKLSPPPLIIVNPPSPPNNKRNIAALTCSFGFLTVNCVCHIWKQFF